MYSLGTTAAHHARFIHHGIYLTHPILRYPSPPPISNERTSGKCYTSTFPQLHYVPPCKQTLNLPQTPLPNPFSSLRRPNIKQLIRPLRFYFHFLVCKTKVFFFSDFGSSAPKRKELIFTRSRGIKNKECRNVGTGTGYGVEGGFFFCFRIILTLKFGYLHGWSFTITMGSLGDV